MNSLMSPTLHCEVEGGILADTAQHCSTDVLPLVWVQRRRKSQFLCHSSWHFSIGAWSARMRHNSHSYYLLPLLIRIKGPMERYNTSTISQARPHYTLRMQTAHIPVTYTVVLGLPSAFSMTTDPMELAPVYSTVHRSTASVRKTTVTSSASTDVMLCPRQTIKRIEMNTA